MHTNRKRIYRDVLLCLILLTAALWYFGYHRPTHSSSSRRVHPYLPPPEPIRLAEPPQFIRDIENAPPLSAEATDRLAQLKKEAETNTAQIRNAEIQFSITYSWIRIPEDLSFLEFISGILMPQEKPEEPAEYDVLGEWNITYRFEGDTEFFDIKARKKELGGGMSHWGTWQETHHQFMRKNGQKLYIRDGTVWEPFKEWKRSLSLSVDIDFDPMFSPQWWRFGRETTFDTLLQNHKVTAVEDVDIDGGLHVYLELYKPEKVHYNEYTAKKVELWLHPQAVVYPKHILMSARTGGIYPLHKEGWFSNMPEPVPEAYEYSETDEYYFYLTSELAEYEGEIWFLKQAVQEYFSRYTKPTRTGEPRLPQWNREMYETAPIRKRVMQVHRAIFNQPRFSVLGTGITDTTQEEKKRNTYDY